MKVSKKKKSYRERQNQEIFSERQRKYIGGDRSEFDQFPEKKYLYRIYLFLFFSKKNSGPEILEIKGMLVTNLVNLSTKAKNCQQFEHQ